MAKSDDVQDERYVAMPWMAKSDDVQDEQYVAVPWMAMSDDVQDVRVSQSHGCERVTMFKCILNYNNLTPLLPSF